MADSKSDLTSTFEKLVRALQEQQAELAEAELQAEGSAWLMPPLNGWSGDLFDLEGLSFPFDRTDANEMFVKAVRDAANPGTVGDTIVATTQVEYLACAERAFRARHTSRRPRLMAHRLGRLEGHGDTRGTLTQTALEYLRNLVRMVKS